MTEGYCPVCDKNMIGKTKISWIIFILLLLMGVLLGLIYLVYCLTKPKVCPVCSTVLEPPVSFSGTNHALPSSVCVKCGSFLNGERFCPKCGAENQNAVDPKYAPFYTVPAQLDFISPAASGLSKKVLDSYLTIDGERIARSDGALNQRVETTNGEHRFKYYARIGYPTKYRAATAEKTIFVEDGMRIWIEYRDDVPYFNAFFPSDSKGKSEN